ncbi:hypothetical protein PIB30_094014 [Stylosanthes scabra]|uniref:Uncharacterized protein n=1 Tax=Stylosanthes scabra TaxID=79078 RepID=A0ABU6YUK6_9FABA|nr:hypothetical protein [Stylosanthes scabra]
MWEFRGNSVTPELVSCIPASWYLSSGQSFQLECPFPEVFLYTEGPFQLALSFPSWAAEVPVFTFLGIKYWRTGYRGTALPMMKGIESGRLDTSGTHFDQPKRETQGNYYLVPDVNLPDYFVVPVHVVPYCFPTSLVYAK